MYQLVYYSPTGNTRYLAKVLAEKLAIDSHAVWDLSMKTGQVSKQDHLIIMAPIHGFNLAWPVLNFAKTLSVNQFKTASILAVGCNKAWVNQNASRKLSDILENKGIEVRQDQVLAMPLTFVMNFPQDVGQEAVETSLKDLDALAMKIKSGEKSLQAVPLKAKVISFVGRAEKHGAKLFGLELHAKKTCTSCGLCWRACPVGNIRQGSKGKPKFGLKCTLCMKCIYDCPEKAIGPYVSRFLPIRQGYDLNMYLKEDAE